MDDLTEKLVEEYRQSRAAVDTALTAMQAAQDAHHKAKDDWQKALKKQDLLRTELTMALEMRHPEQPERQGG